MMTTIDHVEVKHADKRGGFFYYSLAARTSPAFPTLADAIASAQDEYPFVSTSVHAARVAREMKG
jgi:hypothetical protein